MPVIDLPRKYLADLKWLSGACPLLDNAVFQCDRSLIVGWLAANEVEQSCLASELEKANLKMLGPYFEALWEFILTQNPAFKLLAKNRQVREDKNTIGEFDFIYERPTQSSLSEQIDSEVIHLEVAIKFYLGVPCSSSYDIQTDRTTPLNFSGRKLETTDYSELCNWIGPNHNDRLDIKVNRLLNHQSQLAKHPAGIASLEALGVTAARSEVCLLGYLFYPFHLPMAPPKDSAKNHLRGRWLSISRLESASLEKHIEQACSMGSSLWRIVKKPFWLAQNAFSSDDLLDYQSFIDLLKVRFEKIDHPILVARYKSNQSEKDDIHNCRVETIDPVFVELMFIVQDDWESIAYQTLSENNASQ